MTKHMLRLSLLLMIPGLWAISCKKDDNANQTDSGKAKYAVSLTVYGSNSNTGFLVPVSSLAATSVANTNAPEITQLNSIVRYKDWVFTLQGFQGSGVQKFVRNEQGGLTPAGELAASSVASAGPFALQVLNENKAYVALAFTSRIVVFNPTTMQKISEIDVSAAEYASGGANACNPFSFGLRGEELFVGCANFISPPVAANGAHLLIINTNTDQVVKKVDDTRASLAGRYGDATIKVDEKGDMYVYCWASYGYAPGQKHGFLRIKKGETELDPTYFFNCTDYTVSGVQGGKLDYFHRLTYAGNGVFYAVAHNPAYDSNPPDYINDHTLSVARVNVYDHSIENINLPRSIGNGAGIAYDNGKVLFGGYTAAGNGLFTYDPVTNQASATPVVTLQGGPNDIVVFE